MVHRGRGPWGGDVWERDGPRDEVGRGRGGTRNLASKIVWEVVDRNNRLPNVHPQIQESSDFIPPRIGTDV